MTPSVPQVRSSEAIEFIRGTLDNKFKVITDFLNKLFNLTLTSREPEPLKTSSASYLRSIFDSKKPNYEQAAPDAELKIQNRLCRDEDILKTAVLIETNILLATRSPEAKKALATQISAQMELDRQAIEADPQAKNTDNMASFLACQLMSELNEGSNDSVKNAQEILKRLEGHPPQFYKVVFEKMKSHLDNFSVSEGKERFNLAIDLFNKNSETAST
ncbi:hypothetical protein E3A20_16860 [Planctomyces bekefii]|uniref:Uncharacterized protein n=1 Tax=Planctomyces bekefii TaxID=1653850 RepID=A0A5C6M4R1_9PLAN|nr:hypothetical protein E3A20_16860 [Planctomyces bekefii]